MEYPREISSVEWKQNSVEERNKIVITLWSTIFIGPTGKQFSAKFKLNKRKISGPLIKYIAWAIVMGVLVNINDN